MSGGPLTNVRLYHAGNCSLNGNDSGFGFADAATGAVACTQTPGDAPAGPFMEFLPITPNDDWAEAVYSYVYAAIMQQADFPDVVDTNGNPKRSGQSGGQRRRHRLGHRGARCGRAADFLDVLDLRLWRAGDCLHQLHIGPHRRRPPSQCSHHQRAVSDRHGRRRDRVRQPGWPADDGVLPVRAGPEVLRRRPRRVHQLDPDSVRGG